MADSVITNKSKRKMLEIRAGIITVMPKITGVAFGGGSVDASGNIRTPLASDIALQGELLRQEIDGFEVISDTCIKYTCSLAKQTLAGKKINEAALYDADGDLVAIKSFTDKGKDEDMEMIFEIDDTF